MIGETVLQYRIVRKLGSGGMGEVYEAEDTRLGRRVALKFLPEKLCGDSNALERFQREARASSQLNHPNICIIHDIGEHEGRPFIVMELLEGESLKDRLAAGALPFSEVLEIGIQVASALEAAHAQGIVHRDIKPGNIFLSTRGPVKVLDFGLAKLTPVPQGAVTAGTQTGDGDESLTALGFIPGTAYYMSPEQARGEELDFRTDIFSFGVVLYEMATGERPFAGKNSILTLAAVLEHKPATPRMLNPSLPPEFEATVAGALEKDRDRRYETAAEMRAALEHLKRTSDFEEVVPTRPPRMGRARRVFTSVSTGHRYIQLIIAGVLVTVIFVLTLWWVRHGRRAIGPHAGISVLVLPFQNVAHDVNSDYLRFAIADEISTTLTYTPNVEVRPLNTVRYAQGTPDPEQVGRELRASYVIAGHYVLEGRHLIVSLEAVDVRANRVAWQGTFTVAGNDFIAMQKELAAQVRRGLLPVMGTVASSLESATRPSNSEAYDLFLRSIAISHDPDPNKQALSLLERSVSLDPNYAPAWDALGLRYYYEAQYSGGGAAAFDRAVAAYENAARLDPNYISAIAHTTRAHVERGHLDLAYKHAKALVTRRPDNAQAHFTMSYVLRYAGLLNEAGRECDQALALDPGNYAYRSCAFVFAENGNAARAADFVALDAGTDWATNVTPSILLRQPGGAARAAAAAKHMTNDPTWFGSLLTACLSQDSTLFERMSNDLRPALLAQRDPEFRYLQGTLMAYCGNHDLAVELIHSAITGHYCATEALDRDPLLEPLRSTPEFYRLTLQARQCQRAAIPPNASQSK